MKKSLIGLAALHAAAALATNVNARAEAGVSNANLKKIPDGSGIAQAKAAENDDALAMKPIITLEMLAGTQAVLADKKPRYIKKISGFDKTPVHIGGGSGDISVIKRSGPDVDDIQLKATIPTLWRSAQFGGQHHGSGAFAHA